MMSPILQVRTAVNLSAAKRIPKHSSGFELSTTQLEVPVKQAIVIRKKFQKPTCQEAISKNTNREEEPHPL